MADLFKPSAASAIATLLPAFRQQYKLDTKDNRLEIRPWADPRFMQRHLFLPRGVEGVEFLGAAGFKQPDHLKPDAASARDAIIVKDPRFTQGAARLAFSPSAASAQFSGVASFAQSFILPQAFSAPPAAGAALAPTPSFVGGESRPALPPILDLPWDGKSAMVEEYDYAVSISVFDDRDEQRRLLRTAAHGRLAYQSSHVSGGARRAAALAYQVQAGRVLAPQWRAAVRATANVSMGGKVVSGDFASAPLAIGQWVLLWSAEGDRDVDLVDDFDSTTVELRYGASKARAAGSFAVIPLVAGRVPPEGRMADIGDGAGVVDVEVIVDSWPASAPFAVYPDLYLSRPVVDVRAGRGGGAADAVSRAAVTMDLPTAPDETSLRDVAPGSRRSLRLALPDRAAGAKARLLVDALAGPLGTLWVPTGTPDLRLSAAASAGAGTLTIESIGYASRLFPAAGRRHLAVYYPGGVDYLHVTAAVDDGSTETLTLEDATPRDYGLDQVISVLRYCRLDGRPRLSWSSGTNGDFEIDVVELPKEAP